MSSEWSPPVSTLPPPNDTQTHGASEPRVREYEELTGGVGKAIAYRAERYLVKELAPDSEVRLRSSSLDVALRDVSLRGVSFWLEEASFDVGKREISLPTSSSSELCVSVQALGRTVYEGAARVVRHEKHGSKILLAVELLDGMLDMVAIKRAQADASFKSYSPMQGLRSQTLLPEGYRDVVGRMAHLIRECHKRVEAYADKYRDIDLVEPDICDELYRAIQEPWFVLREEVGAYTPSLLGDKAALQAAKDYTEALIADQLLDAPFVSRAYKKPLGYPGDFEMMMQIFRNDFEGSSQAGAVFHKLACEEKLAAGVRTRKDFLVRRTLTHLAEHRARSREPFRITSLACGPAREVLDVVKQGNLDDSPIVWTLIDQEKRALERTYHDVCQAFAKQGKAPTVRCVHLSFGQLLRNPAVALHGEPQHLMYASGLFDYLREFTAKSLIKTMFAGLAPGGHLYIGNAAADLKQFWYTEIAVDWSLIPRTEKEILRLADPIKERAKKIAVGLEPSEAYYFMSAQRKDDS